MDALYHALTGLRAPIQQGEYDLHRLVMDTLDAAAIPYVHEAVIAPRCRIDLLCGRVGIEIKRGKPDRGRLLSQLVRYADSPAIDALILIVERTVTLPPMLHGKPVRLLCLNRLWGIAL